LKTGAQAEEEASGVSKAAVGLEPNWEAPAPAQSGLILATGFVGRAAGALFADLCPHSINTETRNNLFFSFRPCTPAMPCSVEGAF
jgi:hypothetical protein